VIREDQWAVRCTRQFFEPAYGPLSIPYDRGRPKVTLAVFDDERVARVYVQTLEEEFPAAEGAFTMVSGAQVKADRADPEKGVQP
jgi:hypothetical protein